MVNFTEPAVDGTNITINVTLDPGVQRVAPDQPKPDTGRVELLFPLPFPLSDGLKAWAVLLESWAADCARRITDCSDYVFLKVTNPMPGQNGAGVLIGFQSDPFTFPEFEQPMAAVRATSVAEDGTKLVDLSSSFFMLQGGRAVNVPLICPTCQTPFLSVMAQSDVEVPEPSMTLLVGAGFAAVLSLRRTRLRSSSRGGAAQEMGDGPPEPLCRERFQTTASCAG
jgi:hypothetical protein